MKTGKLVAIIVASVVGGCAIMLALLTAIALLIPSDFESEAQKNEVFEQWACNYSETMDDKTNAITAASHANGSKKADAYDKRVSRSIHIAAVVNNWSQVDVPPTVTPNGDTCEGWVWKWFLEDVRENHYDTFTYDDARAYGLVK